MTEGINSVNCSMGCKSIFWYKILPEHSCNPLSH